MSMIGMFRRVSAKTIDELRSNPAGIERVLRPQSTETAIDDDAQIDVDKAWAGIHYLLTGSAREGRPPLNFILHGREVGNIDVGYGPARSFTPADVRRIATALALVTTDQLRARFDPKKMMEEEVYPAIWDRDPAEDDPLAYLLTHFETLKEFITVTAQAEAGLLVYLA